MKKIEKYWLILFILENLSTQYRPWFSWDMPILILSFITAIIIVGVNFTSVVSFIAVKRYPFIYAFILVMLLYQFTFGWMHINEKTWIYIFARPLFAFAMIISIKKNFDYYSKTFFIHLSYLCAGLILYGRFFVGGSIMHYGDTRLELGFGNPNTTSCVGAFSFCFLFTQIQKFNKKTLFVLGVCLYAVFVGGSRIAMLAVIVAIGFKYGFNLRTLKYFLYALGVVFVLRFAGFQIIALDRLVTTVESDDMEADRAPEREACWVQIMEHPIDGNGIAPPLSRAALQISELGSHNGYLDMMKYFGIPFALIIFFVLARESIKLFRLYFFQDDIVMKGHLLICLIMLPSATVECYFIGIHEYGTTLYYISYIILCMQQYKPHAQNNQLTA